MASTVNYSRIKRSDNPMEPWMDDTVRRRIHWRPPVLMLLSFILGLAWAILHHFFYSHWDGVKLDDAWPQIWISRVATALAFLTKLFLAITSSIAYVQQQWLTMHKHSFQLRETDALFGVLSDVTLFWDLRIWMRHPLLAFPALITWLVPIAAVITPSSLTVVTPRITTIESHYVPQLTFNGTAYTYQGGGGSNWYLRTKENVQRLSRSTAMFGAIPQLPYPASNASYQLTYYTPALRCSDAVDILGENFTNYNKAAAYGGKFYFSFVAGDSSWSSLNATEITQNGGGGIEPSVWDTLDRTSEDAATLYIATKDLKHPELDYYYIKCQLWNVSQTVNFDFRFPSQFITVQSPIEYMHGISAQDYGIGNVNITKISGLASVSLMDTFGILMTGQILKDHYSGSWESFQTSSQLTKVDWSSRDTAIRGLEEMFQNMTLSLMTDSSLVKTPAQAGNISVNVTTYPNVYSYLWRQLVLAYGISITCALFSMIIGAQALIRTNASFTNCYSTILRSSKGSRLEDILSTTDDGADPIPKKLKKAEVAL